MNRLRLQPLAINLFVLACVSFAADQNQVTKLTGRVVGITDGDTLTLRTW